MGTPSTPATLAVERLRLSLEAVAGALADVQTSDLLSAEEEVRAALWAAGRIARVLPEERQALASEIQRARLALERCRAIGDVVSQVTAATLALYGGNGQYDRCGHSAAPASSARSSVEVRA